MGLTSVVNCKQTRYVPAYFFDEPAQLCHALRIVISNLHVMLFFSYLGFKLVCLGVFVCCMFVFVRFVCLDVEYQSVGCCYNSVFSLNISFYAIPLPHTHVTLRHTKSNYVTPSQTTSHQVKLHRTIISM